MGKKKILTTIIAGLMVGATMVAPLNIYANTNNNTSSLTVNSNNAVGTIKGVANLGNGKSTILINGNQGQTLVGKEFAVYKLFNAENSVSGESINYTFNPTYEQALKEIVSIKLGIAVSQVTEYKVIDYIQSLNTNIVEGVYTEQPLEGRYSAFRYFVEELRNKMQELNLQPQVIRVDNTRIDNSVQITGLDYGYYLLDEITALQGTHSAGSLCITDTANPTSTVNVKSDYPTITKKIQEDDNRETIGNNGWNDIGDFEIGQTVPYKYDTFVPNMNGYHSYYFAFHDVMDKALTFKPETVSIVISDKTKSYTLKADEFKILTENIGNETFNVVIDNLRKVVDREFLNTDNNMQNTYGQTITLRYDATLNDNASLDTGRPGFENDVRLEFSNDPDNNTTVNAKNVKSTGFTPWDTVVCFTYKLDVTKTNNHDKVLANAKFRLYSDKECLNEVFVKQNADGDYIVINRDSVTGDTPPTEAVEMVSKKNGNFIIYGLDGGTYYLKESKSPTGYRPLLDPIVLTVKPQFTAERNSYIKGDGATDKTLIDLSVTAQIRKFILGNHVDNTIDLVTDVNEGNANLTVVNDVGTKLPASGSNLTLLLVIAGTTLMSASVILYKKNKKGAVNEKE